MNLAIPFVVSFNPGCGARLTKGMRPRAAVVLLLAPLLLLGMATGLMAQSVETQPRHVLSLSARASVDTTFDVITVTLSTTRHGPDAGKVQAELKAAVDAALAVARPQAKAPALTVRTGQFSLMPRVLRDNRPDGWQGTAEVVLQGQDLERVAALAGRIDTLGVAQVSYSLSRERRDELEQDITAQAIARFRERAGQAARAFGYERYTLREVTLSSADDFPVRPMLRSARTEMAMSADAPIPVEAGMGTVTVVVTGSIAMD